MSGRSSILMDLHIYICLFLAHMYSVSKASVFAFSTNRKCEDSIEWRLAAGATQYQSPEKENSGEV